MAFDELECETKDNAKKLAKLSYMPSRRKPGKDDGAGRKPMLLVTLPTVHFISKGARFKIMIGSGNDAGTLRIVKAETGGVKPHEFKSHVILRFGHIPKLGLDMWDAVQCEVTRVDDDTYDMTPPKSCFPAPVVEVVAPRRVGGRL